jgi:nitrogen fixation/metabolism regulation signal transduction histidine kinase
VSSRLSLRTKLTLYLVAVHLALAVAAFFALRERPFLLIAAEFAFAISVAGGFFLVRAFFLPLDLIRGGTQLIEEQDFGSSFRELGQPEMDALVRVYNRMIARLREERLKQQEQQFLLERVLEASPAGFLALDFDGRVSLLNRQAARLLGTSSEEAMGKGVSEIGGSLGGALAALASGDSELVAAPDGRRLKLSRAEFYDRGFSRALFIVTELTEELRASERAAYGKLIRTMSHEVNNSVGAVGSLLDSMRRYGGQLVEADRADHEEAIAVAATRLENLRRFMSGFADVARLPAPDLREHDLRRLVTELLVLLKPQLVERRIEVAWSADAGVVRVAIDRNQIEQVLVNVLQNAMEAIGRDGTIEISLAAGSTAASGAVLRIHDSGPGIPPEARPFLFTPFYSSKRDGRGVGLTLVREILAQHRFAFGLDNDPDGGATFTVTFEARDAPPRPA